MISADYPRAFMISVMPGAFLPHLSYILHPVSHQPDKGKVERAEEKNCNPAQDVLNKQGGMARLIHIINFILI
jgi:hypothetical protein